MKRIVAVLALSGAILSWPVSAGQVHWNIGVGIGFGNGYGYPYRPVPIVVAPGGYYYPPRVIYIPSTVVHVDGARHLPGGRCEVSVNSRWMQGVDRDGMCFVRD